MDFPSTHASLLLPPHEAPLECWEALHLRYRDVILGWCLRREVSHACAEDIAQEIWIKLLRDMSSYDPAKGRFRSWLKAVVNNALTDYFRRQGRQPEHGGVGGTLFLERLANIASPEAAGDLSREIERSTRNIAADVLARVRARLQETTWQAFYQTLVEKRPAGEVAQALGIGVASVYKNTFRVKKMLQEEFGYVHCNGNRAVLSERDDAEAVSA